MHLQSAGGGGCGDPGERDPARVAADLKDGYITESGARENYGFSEEPGE